MIGHIEGKVIFKGEKYAVLDVGGIGYKIYAGADTLKKLGSEKTSFWTHLHVKEDALDLYGFSNQSELEFFELLISISGIGPRSALGILAVAPVDTIKRAVGSGDTTYLTKVSGVGRKTAEKVVLELKDKMGFGKNGVSNEEFKDDADLVEALVALGYSQRDAREMIQKIPKDTKGRENRLKAALKLTKN